MAVVLLSFHTLYTKTAKMLRIKIPKPEFVEIASECDENGTFDTSFQTILLLMQKATRERDYHRTHLLTVSLHAFLHHKGGSYSTLRNDQTGAQAQEAQEQMRQVDPSKP